MNLQGNINQEFVLTSPGDDDKPYAKAADANNNLALLMYIRDNGDIDLTGNYVGSSIADRSTFAMYNGNFDLTVFKDDNMGNSKPKACEFTTSGDLVVSGRLFTSFDFDFDPFPGGDDFYELNAFGGSGYDIFLAKYNSQLDVIYAKNIGDSQSIGDVDDLKINGSDDIFLSGELGGVTDMNFGPLQNYIDGFSSRYCFAAKYSLCNTQVYQENPTICPGESYTLPDGSVLNNINNPITREHRFTGVTSCDSLIITNIQIAPEYSITEQAEVCEGTSYTFPDGSTQTIASQVVQTSSLQTIHGCDSIIENVSMCSGENYTFPDGSTQTNITSQVAHNSVLQNQNGCDSIVETTVNVLSNNEVIESASI